jgi:ubiquinone/menaquinone biosynthesis C-methylase UbiE
MTQIYSRKIAQEKYNLIRNIPYKVMKNYAQIILNFATKNSSILDIGFGTGQLLIPLSFLNQESKIFGIDKSKHMCNLVKKLVGDKANLVNGDINKTLKQNTKYNIVHFKALLHCLQNPYKSLNIIADSVMDNGYLITGHEISQTEDRLEQIFNYKNIDSPEIEIIFEYYFRLRSDYKKPFYSRVFPAGDSWKACKYLIKTKGFSFIRNISNKNLSWNRKIKIKDILDSIKLGTFGVFYNNLTDFDRKKIYDDMIYFVKKHNINLYKTHNIPAKFNLSILKK